jgi:hypothetical protein
VISSSQRPLPDKTQHSQQTNNHATGGIRTHNLSMQAAADLRVRSRGHWDRRYQNVRQRKLPQCCNFFLLICILIIYRYIKTRVSFQNVCEVYHVCSKVIPLTMKIEAKILVETLGSTYNATRHNSLCDYHANVLRSSYTLICHSILAIIPNTASFLPTTYSIGRGCTSTCLIPHICLHRQ